VTESALQVTAEKILGTTAFGGKNVQKEHKAQRCHQGNGHYSSNDKRITAKQTSTQTLKDKIRRAREEGTLLNVIADLGNLMPGKITSFGNYNTKCGRNSDYDWLISTQSKSAKNFTPSMWGYKTDHMQSNLPAQTHELFPRCSDMETRPSHFRSSGLAPVQVCSRTSSLETCTVPLRWESCP